MPKYLVKEHVIELYEYEYLVEARSKADAEKKYRASEIINDDRVETLYSCVTLVQKEPE